MSVHRKKGFTLIEIILAIAILAILIIAFTPSFMTAFRWITDAGKNSATMYNSQNVLENLIVAGTIETSDRLTLTFTDSGGGTPIQVDVDGLDSVNGNNHLFIPTNPTS